MTQVFNPRSIAQEMLTVQRDNHQIEPFSTRLTDLTVTQAYEVACLMHQARIDDGWVSAGRKIGFTNADMWERYGVREPIWSSMYDRTIRYVPGNQAVSHTGQLCELKVEPEIVVHFQSAPPASGEWADILACIDWIALGYEMVQSHFPDWTFKAVDTIIDSGLHVELLVGQPLDITGAGPELLTILEQFEVRLYLNDEQCDQGSGANVLGSPLKAVAHLISVIAANPTMAPIQAGELITTGTLTKAWSVTPGEIWRTEVGGLDLPALTVSFAE